MDQQEATGEIKQTTAYLKRLLIGKHISGTEFGLLKTSQVSQVEFRAFLDGLALGSHSKRNVAGVVATGFRSVGIQLTYGAKKELSKRSRVLEPDERKRLLRAAKGEEKWLIGFLMQMGLRRGEALGVMHEDRDQDGITLRRQVVRTTGAILVTSLKTKQSEAWVPLPKWMARYLGKGEGFVLTEDGVRPKSPTWAGKTVAEVAKRAGLGRVTPHDLRHTAAMALLESGVDVVTAAEILRHDPVMLAKVYAKSRRDLKREALKKMLGG